LSVNGEEFRYFAISPAVVDCELTDIRLRRQRIGDKCRRLSLPLNGGTVSNHGSPESARAGAHASTRIWQRGTRLQSFAS